MATKTCIKKRKSVKALGVEPMPNRLSLSDYALRFNKQKTVEAKQSVPKQHAPTRGELPDSKKPLLLLNECAIKKRQEQESCKRNKTLLSGRRCWHSNPNRRASKTPASLQAFQIRSRARCELARIHLSPARRGSTQA